MSKSTLENLNASMQSHDSIELSEQSVADAQIPNNHIKEVNEEKKFLLTEENFQRLKAIQQEIFEKTDVSPGIRKLLNTIINEDRLNELKNRFIDQFNP